MSDLQAIRSGNYPVVIEDHVLILNWNRQTPSLLRQLALASKEAELSSKKHKRNERYLQGSSDPANTLDGF